MTVCVAFCDMLRGRKSFGEDSCCSKGREEGGGLISSPRDEKAMVTFDLH